MYKVNIVIPVHSEAMEAEEMKSLTQCFKLLKKYTITLACDQKLNDQAYQELAAIYGVILHVERFDDVYFKSANGYNTLLIEDLFYSRFVEYEYVLIYQLDCYIFQDDISEWCSLGFDYIGAPWINTWWLKQTKQELMKKSLRDKSIFQALFIKIGWLFKGFYKKRSLNVGNGGFSLRKVSSCIRVSVQNEFVKSWDGNHEDAFWSIYVPLNFDFKIPNDKKALTFSFDCDPDYLYELNKRKLPMACHAWYRSGQPYETNIPFWKAKIMDNSN